MQLALTGKLQQSRNVCEGKQQGRVGIAMNWKAARQEGTPSGQQSAAMHPG